MSGFKYDYTVDLTDRNNCHTLMLEMIGAGKRVLEVGCATGYMSRVMKERGCEVIGIELDPVAAEQAQEICDEVIVANVEHFDFTSRFDKESMDVVVFGDVLEHLHDPISTLRSVRPLLKPDGYVVASIPNVAHGDVRLALLKGRFDYRAVGLLDETHLRFFTRDGIQRIFKDSGYALTKTERTTMELFQTEVGVAPEEIEPALIDQVLVDPESLTYQFVVKAVLDSAGASIHELHEREQAQRADLISLRRELANSNQQLRERSTALAGSHERNAAMELEIARLTQVVESLRSEHGEVLRALEAAHNRINRIRGLLPVRLYLWSKGKLRRDGSGAGPR